MSITYLFTVFTILISFFAICSQLRFFFIYLKFINPQKSFFSNFLVQLSSWSNPQKALFHIMPNEKGGVKKKEKKNHSLINWKLSLNFMSYIFWFANNIKKIHSQKSLIFGFGPYFYAINVMTTFLPFNLPPQYPYFVPDCYRHHIYVWSRFFQHFVLIWFNV